MTTWSTILTTLTDEGWTESFSGTLAEAVERRVAPYGGLSRTAARGRNKVSTWADHPNVTVKAWVPNPANVAHHDRGATLVVAFADGRPTRKVTWHTGSTAWVDPPNGTVVEMIQRSGITGAAKRAAWEAEKAAAWRAEDEAKARQAALIADLSELCAEAGVDLRPAAMPVLTRVAVDLEALLSVLRSVNTRD